MIFLSAGHHFNSAGNDPGAIGNGYHEADLTRELRDLIFVNLKELGASFIVDSDEETLAQYIKRIRPGNGSVVCELHFNAAATGNAAGIETLVKSGADTFSRELARKVCEVGASACGFFNRGVKTEKESHRGRLAILNTEAGISVLPEICFISNADDVKRYQSYKLILAQRLAHLLKQYDDKVK